VEAGCAVMLQESGGWPQVVEEIGVHQIALA
jgi:hypothetical protein